MEPPRLDSLPALVDRIIAEHSEGVSDEVDQETAAYVDPRYDEVVRLESLREFLERLSAAGPGTADLQRFRQLVAATDGDLGESLQRIEATLRAALGLVPDLSPTVIRALDLDPALEQWVHDRVEAGAAANANEVITDAIQAALEGTAGPEDPARSQS